MGRESAVGERGVRVRHGSNLADEYDDSVAAFPLSHVDVCYPAFFLFTLPAGVLADMFDRKKLLCFMNLWLALVAAGLAIANGIGLANPYLILGTVFLLGIGFAFNAPAWTAIIPEVVTKEDLPSATTLGGLQLNISGIVGPAIGGLVLARLGVNFVFAINSVCFLLVILAVLRWKSLREASHVPLEGFMESLASAIGYIRHTPGVRVVVVRVSLFALFISIIPALLPVVGLKQLNLNASQLGFLFTSLSIGSVLGAVFVVPTVRANFSPNRVTILATALLILVYFLMGCIRQPEAFSWSLEWLALAGPWQLRLWVAGQIAAPELARRPAKRRIYDGVECEYGAWRNSLGRACSIQGIGIYVARRLHSSPNQSAVAFPVFYRRGSGA